MTLKALVCKRIKPAQPQQKIEHRRRNGDVQAWQRAQHLYMPRRELRTHHYACWRHMDCAISEQALHFAGRDAQTLWFALLTRASRAAPHFALHGRPSLPPAPLHLLLTAGAAASPAACHHRCLPATTACSLGITAPQPCDTQHHAAHTQRRVPALERAAPPRTCRAYAARTCIRTSRLWRTSLCRWDKHSLSLRARAAPRRHVCASSRVAHPTYRHFA